MWCNLKVVNFQLQKSVYTYRMQTCCIKFLKLRSEAECDLKGRLGCQQKRKPLLVGSAR